MGTSALRDRPEQHAGFLQVERVSVRFPGRWALRNVSLDAGLGEVLVLLGPNGAGKSTLIRTICGRQKRKAGTVRLDGRDPVRVPAARRLVGIVPQQIALFERLSARENLTTFGRLMGLSARDARRRSDELLERVALGERARDVVGALSGGMRRRINIAAALMHRPKLLILDEPTAGLDAASKSGLVDLLRGLRRDGLAVLLTTHDMEEADALADRVAILLAGQLCRIGTVEELVAAAFGGAKEIKLTLSAHAVRDPRLSDAVAELRRAHLTPVDGGRTWTGLVEGGTNELGYLLGTTNHFGNLIEHVGVRQPGLESLMKDAMARMTAEAA